MQGYQDPFPLCKMESGQQGYLSIIECGFYFCTCKTNHIGIGDLGSFRLLSLHLLSFCLLSKFCVISPTRLKMPKNG